MRLAATIAFASITFAACGGGDPGPVASGGSVADAVAAINAQSEGVRIVNTDGNLHPDPRIVNDSTSRSNAQALLHADPRIVNDSVTTPPLLHADPRIVND